MKRTTVALSTIALLLPLSACGGHAAAGGDGSTVTVTVGYQSKTINTVTAGTLLRSLGYFEKELNALHDGHTCNSPRASGSTTTPVRPSPGCTPPVTWPASRTTT